ncbi:Crp/Fnr family transcriptional regulator [Colwellia piezophila]|uniref:Crp/Fnr family transcriptional regulator n=1 Tax=Colwellia piezophila TaxID=211668 RepID=UPI00035FA487|nr:Crp/Fnr family transcriptional regulator [Colwellia piezophila]
MVKNITIDDIAWPCELSLTLKKSLLSIASFKDGITSLGGSPKHPFSSGICYLFEGIVILSTSTLDTSATVGGVIGPQDWIGAGVMDESYRPIYTSEEVVPVVLMAFPKKLLLKLAEQDSEVFKFLFYIAQKSLKKWTQAAATVIHDKEMRIVFSLLELLVLHPKKDDEIPPIKISQQQLAFLSGISRPRVNEVLKALEIAEEIEITRGSLRIINLPKLAARLNNLNVSLRDPRQFISEYQSC